MEARMKKHREVSPERAMVWTEKSPKYQQNRRVAVVYYLCRSRQLEHPHFMEVSVSSPKGLYLRDVTNRLNALRGRGMASLYSWSSKRSYKNGYVWHDLCEDDLILPSNGSEYVLKGSELFEEPNSDRLSPAGNTKTKNVKQLTELASSRNHIDSSSSSSMIGKNSKHSQDGFYQVQHQSSSDVSPESRVEKSSSSASSATLTEYKVYKNGGLADASTQTEEAANRHKRETCTRGVSTEDGSSEPPSSGNHQSIVPVEKENSEICRGGISPPPSSSSASSSGGKSKTETLESLIRADASKMNSFRILEEEEIQMTPNTKLKATNVLMQLISCGSISVKDHSLGLIPTYKPGFNHSKFQSPLFSTSVMLGELDCLLDKPRMMGLRLEDREYFSGSLIETKMLKQKGDGLTGSSLKRSSSYNADRSCSKLGSAEDKEESTSGHSKCIHLPIPSMIKHLPQSGSMKSPVSSKPRKSSDEVEGSQIGTPSESISGSKRMTQPCSGTKQPKKLDSSAEENEKVIKFEERLSSGARIIIQSTAHCDAAIKSC